MKSRSVVICLCCLIGIPAHAQFNAQYVSMAAPDTVLTDQVFHVEIGMKNTGSASWGHDVRLYTQNPPENKTWAGNFCFIPQGVSAGTCSTYIFTTDLRAPSMPGARSFVWQCARDSMLWGDKTGTCGPFVFFGQTTPNITLYVKQREEQPPVPISCDSTVLEYADFEYAGSFKPPNGGYPNRYTQSGLALRKMGDGSKRLFIYTDTYISRLCEIEIPKLVKINGNNFSQLNEAGLLRVWGTMSADSIAANGGFWWDDSARTIYWTHWSDYMIDPEPTVGATRLNDDGTMTSFGPWDLAGMNGPYKGYFRGVLHLSKSFADAYTGGRDLGLGFGGVFSIASLCSRGPALAALRRPDPATDTVDMIDLLYYLDDTAKCAPRDGDYFSGNGGCYWYEIPPKPWSGFWTAADACITGVFIDLPGKHAYLSFAKLARNCQRYYYGGCGSDSIGQWWYSYTLSDLGKVATGAQKPWEVKPAALSKVTYPGNASLGHYSAADANITGSCFDDETGMLYLYQRGALDGFPAVHAYHVKNFGSAVQRHTAVSVASFSLTAHTNPFNPVVTIACRRLQGEGSKILYLEIYDIHGTVITKLPVTGYQLAAGIPWNASNRPNGAYIVKLKTKNVLLTKKFMLLK